jgi:hypothetical protein
MPSGAFIELTNRVSAGRVVPLTVPGTWSPTIAQANRVLLDGGDISVVPSGLTQQLRLWVQSMPGLDSRRVP